ncbi:MAG: MerR family transcriptional regulator [Armatimonadota bacterium]
MSEASGALQVGELARRTGLTIRTLHHYDEIGLLKPSRHTEAGYRLYTPDDVARLQQVLSLRGLGLSLEEIRDCLHHRRYLPVEVIRLHVTRLREQMERQRGLCERLEALAAHFHAEEKVPTDELLRTIKEMTMVESYYTPEQLAYLEQRRQAAGEERMRQAPQDWADLTADVKAEMAKGTDPTAPEALALARRWNALIEEFTGGDPGIRESLNRLWAEQGEQIAAQHQTAYEPEVAEYIGKALAALNDQSPDA